MYEALVTHARRTPVRHAFRYRVVSYAIDLAEAGELDRRLRLFTYDRPGPVSLRSADHVGDAARGIDANAREILLREGLPDPERIVLLTNLRVLGYVFNPISVLYCLGPGDVLQSVLAEVSNTFGERHVYPLDVRDAVARRGPRTVWETAKRMHVSPFLGMDQRYRFSLTPPGDTVHVGISVLERGGDGRWERPLHASLAGRRVPLTDRNLALVQLRHPLMPQRVTGLIHLEALRLYRKGVTFHRIPRFRTGSGSLTAADPGVPPAPDGGATRPGLRPPPPAGRHPATPVIRRLTPWALSRPPVGVLELETPDGRVRRFDSGNPGPRARLTVNSKDVFRRFASRGMTGVGEAYVAGDWDADDLPAAIELLLRTATGRRDTGIGTAVTRIRDMRPRLPDRVSHAIAGHRIRYHYDLGNDLYALFLDPSMTYSCAVFARPGMTLEEAQRAKHRMICEKLRLGPDDHVLEIGCGWGAFAAVAAGEYGARVTGVTLSIAQYDVATARLRDAGLADRVRILLQDYRTLEDRFTKIASTEMIEAIGHHELPTYFRTCDRLLAPGGLVFVQAIAMPDQRYERYRRSRDWISEYIFPGGNCPSLEAMVRAMRRASDLIVHHLEDIGPHYAETLRLWRGRFEANRDAVRALGFDEEFIRGWRFYLASCEAAFRARSIHDYQLVLTRPLNDRLPGVPAAAAADPAGLTL